MPATLKDKPDRKTTLDPIAAARASRVRRASDDLHLYRSAAYAAAVNENFDVDDLAAVMERHGWDAFFGSDVEAAKCDLSIRDFESGYDDEMQRLDDAASHPETIPISAALVSVMLRKMQGQPGAIITMPREVMAAVERYRSISGKQQLAFAQMRTLRSFRGYNLRLFSSDIEQALADKRLAITLSEVDRLSNIPNGLSRNDEAPIRHPLAR
jgi:hypothetical protein